ncbi:hypothetical protein F2Q68_00021466 [Brassica cretica]|uniref:CCHC-type domain-containing protein n=1 Tax=Brassica cretica TaxID=69181 RepID=A0A8S9FUP1_BRACR|nr:hypothetical protein F2Q68_00021466 [Brassica cretica]
MCCWFCGKVGHKKVECFAREKSRNMAKKVNKTFTKPRRVEEVSLAKSGLLDEIKDETSEDGCSSVRSDLQEDQEALSVESGHGVVCDTKGKEIEVRQEVVRDDFQGCEITPRQLQRVQRALGADGEGLMVKDTTHEGSQVLNRSGSRGSSIGASDRDAVLVIPLQQGLGRMVIFWYRGCISHGGEKHVWCTSRGGEKHIWCGSFQVGNVVATWLLNQKNVVLDRHTKGAKCKQTITDPNATNIVRRFQLTLQPSFNTKVKTVAKPSVFEDAYLMGEKSMVWCTSRGGEKHIWYESFQVRNVVAEPEECCA